MSKYWQYCLNVKGPTYKYRGAVNFFSNFRKLKIMVGVKVFAMKNIYTERILVGRTFDIRAILPIFRDFTLIQGQNCFWPWNRVKSLNIGNIALMSKGLPTSIGWGVHFFSNSRKLKVMVGVKVFAMKNIVM